MKKSSRPEATFDQERNDSLPFSSDPHAPDFAERVRLNQRKLRADLKPRYDFIVCGSGSSGSVVARRLVENALLLEERVRAEQPGLVCLPGRSAKVEYGECSQIWAARCGLDIVRSRRPPEKPRSSPSDGP